MAKAIDDSGDPTRLEGKTWSPSKLTGLCIVTLIVAIGIIVFMATRLTTCMYLDGSH